jgi:hypothetical protein
LVGFHPAALNEVILGRILLILLYHGVDELSIQNQISLVIFVVVVWG